MRQFTEYNGRPMPPTPIGEYQAGPPQPPADMSRRGRSFSFSLSPHDKRGGYRATCGECRQEFGFVTYDWIREEQDQITAKYRGEETDEMRMVLWRRPSHVCDPDLPRWRDWTADLWPRTRWAVRKRVGYLGYLLFLARQHIRRVTRTASGRGT